MEEVILPQNQSVARNQGATGADDGARPRRPMQRRGFRLAADQLVEGFGKLVRREMSVKPPSNMPRWLKVDTPHGQVRAPAFVSNRKGRASVGQLTIEQVADTLSHACGHWGSGAEYLLNTIVHLENHGIRDNYLWRLQDLVAERIANFR
jgi:glutathione-specific gamma-glutamylcyclotransferase